MNSRLKKILDTIDFEATHYGLGVADKIGKSFSDLMKPIDENSKDVVWLNTSDFQLGDCFVHGSKQAYAKEKFLNINLYVMSRANYHFSFYDIYSHFKHVKCVVPIKDCLEATNLINELKPTNIVYPRGKVYHGEFGYGTVLSSISSNVGSSIWKNYRLDSSIKPKLCIHLRNTLNCPFRNYPLDKWSDFIMDYCKEFDVLPIAHPNLDIVPDYIGGIKVYKQRDLKELNAILGASDIFIGTDTGPLHLAATFEHLKCVSLIDTSNEWWNYFPYKGEKYSILSTNLNDILPYDIYQTLMGNRPENLIPSKYEKTVNNVPVLQ